MFLPAGHPANMTEVHRSSFSIVLNGQAIVMSDGIHGTLFMVTLGLDLSSVRVAFLAHPMRVVWSR